ncbi:MAG TPA: phosphate ABC transporter permease PstA [Pseudonocardiaceae bacterium]
MTDVLEAPKVEAAEVVPPPPDLPRKLSTTTRSDWLALLGSAVAAVALVWVVYDRLLPWSGTFGFIVCWFLVFLLIHGIVLAQTHNRAEIATKLMSTVVHAGAIVVGGALVMVVVSTVWQGREALGHLNFYTQTMALTGTLAPLSSGGVLHALVGTLIQVLITIVITLPLGVLAAVYLNEVGRQGARVVRVVVEAMTALPDIVSGLFIYVVLLVGLGVDHCGFAAAAALSINMLPITARAAEVVLRVVPGGLREAALALGASQWSTVWRVVLPTARSGLATALILGVARGVGETAPLLLNSGFTTFMHVNPFSGSMVSLPLFIYDMVRTGVPSMVTRAFGAATILLVLVVLLFVLTRLIAGKRRRER